MEVPGVPYFLKRYASHLDRWSKGLTSVVKCADYIVSISRKGPALLELLMDHGFFDQETKNEIREKMVSEFAIFKLPGFDHLGRKGRFLLVDDSLIFGSTFLKMINFIGLCHPGAEVIGAPFAVVEQSQRFAQSHVQIYGLLLRETEEHRYFRCWTQAMLTRNKPLLTTLPIIEATLPSLDNWEQVKHSMQVFADAIDGEFVEVKHKVGLYQENSHSIKLRDFHSGLVTIPTWELHSDKESEPYNAFAGLKFYYEKLPQNNSGFLRITPSCHLTFSLIPDKGDSNQWLDMLNGLDERLARVALQRLECPADFAKEDIQNLIKNSCCLSHRKSDAKVYYSKYPSRIAEHLANFHNYLAAFQLLRYYREKLCDAFGFDVSKSPLKPSRDSLRLLTGNKNLDDNITTLDDYLNAPDDSPKSPLPAKCVKPKYVGTHGCREQFFDHIPALDVDKFLRNLFNLRKRLCNLELDKNSDIVKKFKTIFAFDYLIWRQHWDLDVLSRDPAQNNFKDRLKFGINYEMTRSIVKYQANASMDERDFDRFLSKLFERNIDTSCLVPSYFSNEQNYLPSIVDCLEKWQEKADHSMQDKRYSAVLHVARYFRAGEGIPQTVQQFFAENMVNRLFSETGQFKKLNEKKDENLWQLWEIDPEDEIRVLNIPYIPLYEDDEDPSLDTERLYLWEEELKRAIRISVLPKGEYVS